MSAPGRKPAALGRKRATGGSRQAAAATPATGVETGLAELRRLARRARARAHAPFSRFKVGAALRTRRGEIVTGCNIENATYGLTLCAERVAVVKAVSEGLRGFDAVAVAAPSKKGPPAPCGPCRQILWEFCGDILVHMDDLRGHVETLRLSELLPKPFDARDL